MDESESVVAIGGWVTIDNYSGKKYVDAKLKLIAGDVNTVTSTASPTMPMNQMAYAKTGAPSFDEKSFADYHMYTLS